MDNLKIKGLIKNEPQQVIDIIEQRVRTINFIEDQRRNDLLDYIAAKVSAQISPFLRLARQERRGTFPKWARFQELLESGNLQHILTRENNYGPLPDWLEEHKETLFVCDLLDYIDFFNDLHAREDKRKEKIFAHTFYEWAKPALLIAFEKVDVEKSDKEIVSYTCKAFYSQFIETRAKSQGFYRVRRGGKMHYYYRREVNDFVFTETDVMEVIFHEESRRYQPLTEMAGKLTKKQTQFLITLHNYVRDDVVSMTTDEFYVKYPHRRMSYRKTANELGINYDSFAKTVQRIKKRIS